MFKKSNYHYFIFAILVAIYAILVLTLPVNKLILAYYHISLVGLRFIELTYIIPQILTWSLALYGFLRITRYAKTIDQYKDGRQMKIIGLGIGIYAFSAPSINIISSVLNAIARNHIHFIPTATIISNYLSLLLPLTAFILIGIGISGLLSSIKARVSYIESLILGFLFVVISSCYSYLVFHKLPHTLNLGVAAKPIYYLPNWLVLFTLVIPYLFVWFIGGLAILHIRAYKQKVKGVIYKSSLLYFEIGITFIVISYIVLEYLTTVSSKLLTLKLLPLLLIIYPLLALVGFGYLCIALGAKKLQKIEES